MAGKYSKRVMVSLLPKWEEELDQLKQEQFYKETQAAMFRYIISRGLEVLKQEKLAKGNVVEINSSAPERNTDNPSES